VVYSAPWLVVLIGLSWNENHKINNHRKAADEGRLDWWFLNSVGFVIATSFVVIVLYRREFYSRTLRAIRSGVELTVPGPQADKKA
jgi:hypothetical protein